MYLESTPMNKAYIIGSIYAPNMLASYIKRNVAPPGIQPKNVDRCSRYYL